MKMLASAINPPIPHQPKIPAKTAGRNHKAENGLFIFVLVPTSEMNKAIFKINKIVKSNINIFCGLKNLKTRLNAIKAPAKIRLFRVTSALTLKLV